MNDLRIGVIGSGGRGGLAMHAHRPEKGARVVACCDRSSAAFEANMRWYGADLFTTTDYRKLLNQSLDAVFICTPDWLHEEHALAAIEAGVAVYLEKPMAITLAGADRILRRAQETQARLFVGHNMRYMTIFRKMKQLIDQGRIGEVKSIWCRHFISYGGDSYFRDWHAQARHTTGLLLQKGAHDIDVIHWLAGAYSKRVAAFGGLAVYGGLPRQMPGESANRSWDTERWPPGAQRGFSPEIDVEDQTTMIMELEGGILGAYLQCHFTPDACRNYTVIGTEGRMENLGDAPDAPIFIWNRRSDTYRWIGDEVHRGDPAAEGGHGGADPLIVEEFLRFARHGGPTVATPLAARMAVAAGYLATVSLRNGGTPQDVPPPPL